MTPTTLDRQGVIRVLVVDDEPVAREGLRYGLRRDGDIEVVAEAGSARDAFQIVDRAQPHVILLDVVLPGLDGVTAARDLRHRAPRSRILMLTVHTRVQNALDALAVGAAGFALKTESLDDLRAAVRTVAAGGRYLAPALAATIETRDRAAVNALQALSLREREVFHLVATGARAADIARELCISRKTVETHLHRLYRKLGCHGSFELVRFAAAHGLLRAGGAADLTRAEIGAG